MNFTPDEINLLCIYDTTSRSALIDNLCNATIDFDDDELLEIARGALDKLRDMTDVEFAAIDLTPEFDFEDDEGEV